MFRIVFATFLVSVLAACEVPVAPPQACEPVVIYVPEEPSEPDCEEKEAAGTPTYRKLALQVRNRGSEPIACATRRWNDSSQEWRELDAVASGGAVQTLDYFAWDTLEAEGTAIRCDDLEIVGWIDSE